MVTIFFVVEIPDNLQITAHHFSDLVKVPRGFFGFFFHAFTAFTFFFGGGKPFPIGSGGRVYLPTFTIDINQM